MWVAVCIALCVAVHTVNSETCSEPAVDLRLQPKSVRPSSFLSSPPGNDVITVTRSRPLPRVVVQILNGNGEVDVPASEYIKVRVAGSHSSVSLSGNEAVVYNGEAHFTDLRVNNVEPGLLFFLNFTAIVESTSFERAVNGKRTASAPMRMLSTTTSVFALDFVPVRSYIGHKEEPVHFVSGASLPAFRLVVLDSAYDKYVRPLAQGAGSNETVVAEFDGPVPAGTYVSGSTSPVVQGVALFSEFAIFTDSATTQLPRLRFSLSGTTLEVRTGSLIATRLTENARISFDDESVSFVYSAEQNISATGGVALPPIQISLRNTLLERSPPSTGLVITASIPSGGRAKLSGNVVGVVNGIARFDALRFEQIEHTHQLPYVITFVAGAQGALPLAGSTLVTGVVLVSSRTFPAYSMRFRQSASESFFTAQGQDAQVVQGQLRLPVQVELLDSANNVDTNTSTVTVDAIQAVSTGDQTVLAQQTFTGGRITFSSLRLAAAQDPSSVIQLLFRAKVSSAIVGGSVLASGYLNVTSEVRNFDIQFQPYGASLFTLPDQDSFATVGVPLPPIIVEIVTSAQVVDTQSNEIGITATADGGAIVSGGFIRVSGGVAVFSSLAFVSETPGTYKITFTAGTEGDTAVAGKSVTTGSVTVVSARTPEFRLKFQNTSYIAFPGQVMPLTLGVPIPNISVQLVDSTHSTSVTNTTGVAHPRLRAVVSLSGGFAFSSGLQSVGFVDGVAVFENLRVDSAFNPILTVCVESARGDEDPDPANGHCVSSGALATYSNYGGIGALRLLTSATVGVPVDITRQFSTTPVTKGATLRVAVGILDSAGGFPSTARNLIPLSVGATSTIPLSGDTRVDVNRTTGVAYFSNLRFSQDFPLGISPIITFSVVLGTSPTQAELAVRPISTGLLSVTRTGQAEGVEVVAEILTEYTTFDFDKWRAAVARRLNVETARIVLLYKFSGTSAAVTSTVTADTTYRSPEWRGTRAEMRFIPPLPTSRDTKSAGELASFFVGFVPSCRIGELQLRRAYLAADDRSCDWYIFDSQMNGVRACIQARGKQGYCGCHIPLFKTMGMRCLGLPRMTNLCLDVLINRHAANCKQEEIESVCKLLQFPDVPREELVGTGFFLFLFFPPLLYMYYRGVFHKIGRDGNAKVHSLEPGGREGLDLL
uniref:Uncharacterized protein n=1 Tax=Neobodo designis TaxID=312471 RepID=A0A7S1MMB1_NEODS